MSLVEILNHGTKAEYAVLNAAFVAPAVDPDEIDIGMIDTRPGD